jgi:hypothetical protein
MVARSCMHIRGLAMLPAVLLMVLVCGACSGRQAEPATSRDATAQSSSGVTATAASEASSENPGGLKPWAFETAAPPPETAAAGPASPAPSSRATPGPGKELVFTPTVTREYNPLSPPTGTPFSVCSLISALEFSRWAGDATARPPLELEDGEACGFKSLDDTRRMAIGLIPQPDSPGTAHFIPDAAGGEVLQTDLRPNVTRVRWVRGYPVTQSSSLSVETPGFDLVIEMSSRDPSDDARLRAGALEFARIALAKVPSNIGDMPR